MADENQLPIPGTDSGPASGAQPSVNQPKRGPGGKREGAGRKPKAEEVKQWLEQNVPQLAGLTKPGDGASPDSLPAVAPFDEASARATCDCYAEAGDVLNQDMARILRTWASGDPQKGEQAAERIAFPAHHREVLSASLVAYHKTQNKQPSPLGPLFLFAGKLAAGWVALGLTCLEERRERLRYEAETRRLQEQPKKPDGERPV
jgi:hypothetical protein